MIATGYYGVPGSAKGNFTVHAVQDGSPMCGWRPRKGMEFQWCAWGFQWKFIQCERCKAKAAQSLETPRP